MKLLNLIKYFWHGKKKLRYRHWRKGFVKQHSLSEIKSFIGSVYDYKQIKRGDVKKGEGDIVIIGLQELDWLDFKEYISHTHSIDRVETKGIYTNIYFGHKFFNEMLNEINENTPNK